MFLLLFVFVSLFPLIPSWHTGLPARGTLNVGLGPVAPFGTVRRLGAADGDRGPPSGLVGAAGLEPAAFCSQSRRATKLRHAPCNVMLSRPL